MKHLMYLGLHLMPLHVGLYFIYMAYFRMARNIYEDSTATMLVRCATILCLFVHLLFNQI